MNFLKMNTRKEAPGGGGGGGGVLVSSLNMTRISLQKSQAEAANKHALAERNRRKRINTHLNTLGKLFPYLPKRDKPRVLTETVKHLKELRKRIADRCVLMENGGDGGCCSGSGNGASSLFLPSEKDELNVSYCDGDNHDDHEEAGKTFLTAKAIICCEDRPRLNGELTEAVKSIKGKVVKAEMATIGGRTKAVLLVQWCNHGDGAGTAEEVIGLLTQALKAVVENRAWGSSTLLGSHLVSSSSTILGFERVLSSATINGGRPFYDFPGR